MHAQSDRKWSSNTAKSVEVSYKEMTFIKDFDIYEEADRFFSHPHHEYGGIHQVGAIARA